MIVFNKKNELSTKAAETVDFINFKNPVIFPVWEFLYTFFSCVLVTRTCEMTDDLSRTEIYVGKYFEAGPCFKKK